MGTEQGCMGVELFTDMSLGDISLVWDGRFMDTTTFFSEIMKYERPLQIKLN